MGKASLGVELRVTSCGTPLHLLMLHSADMFLLQQQFHACLLVAEEYASICIHATGIGQRQDYVVLLSCN